MISLIFEGFSLVEEVSRYGSYCYGVDDMWDISCRHCFSGFCFESVIFDVLTRDRDSSMVCLLLSIAVW